MQLRHIQVGISFPSEILSKIDIDRGDIPRSPYMMRLIEKVLQTGDSSRSPQSAETQAPNGFDSNG